MNTEHLVESQIGSIQEGRISRTISKGPLHNSGDPASRKLRIVCRKCNNGWASVLQEKAKPILIPLLTGRSMMLNLEAQHTLAAWATMFTLVYESGIPDASATPEEYLRLFASNQQPLGYWVISFGSYSGSVWRTRIESYSSFVKYGYGSPFAPKQKTKPNTQATTAVIGNFLLHTFYSFEVPLWLFGETFHRSLKLNQIWPHVTETLIPSLGAINDPEAFRIASVFREFDSMGRKRETLKHRSVNRGARKMHTASNAASGPAE